MEILLHEWLTVKGVILFTIGLLRDHNRRSFGAKRLYFDAFIVARRHSNSYNRCC